MLQMHSMAVLVQLLKLQKLLSGLGNVQTFLVVLGEERLLMILHPLLTMPGNMDETGRDVLLSVPQEMGIQRLLMQVFPAT